MARLDSDVSSRQVSPEPASRATRSHFRAWAVLLIVLVAMAGGGIGLSLGSRQGGPLMGPVEKERGPLAIVLPTSGSAPALSPVLSPSPPPSPSPVPPSVVAGASAQPAAAASQYVVQPGDTLRSIALEQYGDAELWQMIYQANRSTIGPNPDALVAGKTLQIPSHQ